MRLGYTPASCSAGDSSFANESARLQHSTRWPLRTSRDSGSAVASITSEQPGTVEIEFATGGRMRITGSVDAATVSALIRALAKSKRRR